MSRLSLTNLLSPDRIKVPIESGDKDGVIGEMCDFLSDLVGVDEDERAGIRRAVFEREAVLSTGIGGAVALPHGKSDALDELVLVAGRTVSPVDFDALDEKPVSIVLLLVGPESAASEHVRVLSRVGRVMRSPRLIDVLTAADSPAAFRTALEAAETS